jgi:glycosyltransferase involved in cell wall biosynthesis
VKHISCIIPAYNEKGSLEHTLIAVASLIGKELHEVIVVNDASTDNTEQIVEKFPSIILINHEKNEGKSKSVSDGIAASSGDYVFLLDADLLFLTSQNIVDLINPVLQDKSQISMSYRKNAWPLFPFKKIDYLTGERILPKAVLLDQLDDMSRLPSYGLEVFLNNIIIKKQLSISVIQWPNVENNFNQNKRGYMEGILTIINIWLTVLSTISPLEMYRQNIRLEKLLVYTA